MDKRFRELLHEPLSKLISKANKVRRDNIGNIFECCSIINAKSGRCSEDCKYCAQSVHHNTDILEYPLLSNAEIVKAAKTAKDNGAWRFSIVTSGNSLNDKEIELIASATREIKKSTGLLVCGSLGSLSADALYKLHQSGMSRYHHNIETSPRFYPSIVSTHNSEDRINTIKRAQDVGMEVCSGGILGLGETWEDRIDMAVLLKKLKVTAIPLNFLIPIKGTALESQETINPVDAIKAIAIFRIIVRDIHIKIIAGRETILKDYQAMGFMAGANGMMVGGYLTVGGRSVEEDKLLTASILNMWKE